MISDEAVEAAAKAVFANAETIQTPEYAAKIARWALEAAAPYMLADAWQAGHVAGDGDQSAMWDARLAGKPAKYADVLTANPYRSQG